MGGGRLTGGGCIIGDATDLLIKMFEGTTLSYVWTIMAQRWRERERERERKRERERDERERRHSGEDIHTDVQSCTRVIMQEKMT